MAETVASTEDVAADTRPDPDATTADITTYLASKNLPPRGQQVTPVDHTKEFPSFKESAAAQMTPPPQLPLYNPAYFAAQRPNDRYESPMNVFKDPAVMLAGLSSLLTRRPLTTALNAGAEAMKAYHQGQKDVYQQNREKFQDNLKAAMEQNKVELARYNVAWKNREETNWQDAAPKLYEEAARNGDSLMITALNSHNWELVEKILLGRQASLNRYEQAQALQDIRYGGSRREQAQSIYKGIKDGTQPPTLTGMTGLAPAIRALASDDGFDLASAQLDYARAQKQVQSLSGPQMTRYVGLTKSVLKTIDEVKDLADKMQQGGIYYYNQFELAKLIKTEGNTERGRLATRYLEAVGVLKEEVANLAQGGYAPTEPAWTLANQQVNENYGAAQLIDSLSEMKRLLNYRFKQIPGIETIGPGAPNPYLPTPPAAPGDTGGPKIIKYDAQGNRISE
jgi:hypothetical protein